MNIRGRDPFDELRKTGAELNLPTGPDPADVGIELESADDLINRLKEKHGPLGGTEQAVPGKQPRRPEPHNWWIRAGAAAVASIAIVTVLVIQPWSNSTAVADEPPVLDYEFAAAADIAHAPGRPAAGELTNLAQTAARQPVPAISGEVQHVVTDNWFAEVTTDSGEAAQGAIIPTFRETWLLPDGSIVALEHDGKPLSADGRTDPQVDRPPTAVIDQLPAGTADPRAATSLPTNATLARAELLKRAGCPAGAASVESAGCLLQAVADLHTSNVLTPTISAALWSALALEPDLTTLGTVTDRLGREGIGITTPPGRSDFRLVLIVAPDTGELLGTETILIRELPDLDLQSPAIYAFTAYVTSEFTEPGAVPRDSDS